MAVMVPAPTRGVVGVVVGWGGRDVVGRGTAMVPLLGMSVLVGRGDVLGLRGVRAGLAVGVAAGRRVVGGSGGSVDYLRGLGRLGVGVGVGAAASGHGVGVVGGGHCDSMWGLRVR